MGNRGHFSLILYPSCPSSSLSKTSYNMESETIWMNFVYPVKLKLNGLSHTVGRYLNLSFWKYWLNGIQLSHFLMESITKLWQIKFFQNAVCMEAQILSLGKNLVIFFLSPWCDWLISFIFKKFSAKKKRKNNFLPNIQLWIILVFWLATLLS